MVRSRVGAGLLGLRIVRAGLLVGLCRAGLGRAVLERAGLMLGAGLLLRAGLLRLLRPGLVELVRSGHVGPVEPPSAGLRVGPVELPGSGLGVGLVELPGPGLRGGFSRVGAGRGRALPVGLIRLVRSGVLGLLRVRLLRSGLLGSVLLASGLLGSGPVRAGALRILVRQRLFRSRGRVRPGLRFSSGSGLRTRLRLLRGKGVGAGVPVVGGPVRERLGARLRLVPGGGVLRCRGGGRRLR